MLTQVLCKTGICVPNRWDLSLRWYWESAQFCRVWTTWHLYGASRHSQLSCGKEIHLLNISKGTGKSKSWQLRDIWKADVSSHQRVYFSTDVAMEGLMLFCCCDNYIVKEEKYCHDPEILSQEWQPMIISRTHCQRRAPRHTMWNIVRVLKCWLHWSLFLKSIMKLNRHQQKDKRKRMVQNGMERS